MRKNLALSGAEYSVSPLLTFLVCAFYIVDRFKEFAESDDTQQVNSNNMLTLLDISAPRQ